MKPQRIVDLASIITTQGRPYRIQHLDEGDAESGPFTVEERGWRLGRLKLSRCGGRRWGLHWLVSVSDPELREMTGDPFYSWQAIPEDLEALVEDEYDALAGPSRRGTH